MTLRSFPPCTETNCLLQNVQYFSASVHIPLEHLRSTSYSVQKAPAPIKHLLDRKVTNLRENEETQAQLS